MFNDAFRDGTQSMAQEHSALFIALVPVSLPLVFVAGVMLILHGAGLV